MQSASLEWIPLFLLCWVLLLTQPRPLVGIAAALALWLVLLCDDYYFLYCVLAAAIVFLWYAVSNRSLGFLVRAQHLIPVLLFAGTALLLTGPLIGSLLMSNAHDPLLGAHDPAFFSLDLLGLLIPGGSWLFNNWTRFYWDRLPGNITENSVFLALPVFLFIVYLWGKRRFLEPARKLQLYLWSSIAGIFFLLALGPVLDVAGMPVFYQAMPYTLLGRLLPFLDLSGVPARMTAMVALAAAVLSAFALQRLWAQFPRRRFVTLALLAVLLFESLPAPIVTTTVAVPGYVTALAALPNDGGVLDLLKPDQVKLGMGLQLYYQTIHGKPITTGYLARLPSSVAATEWPLSLAVAAHDYAKLWGTYQIRYILSSDPLPARPDQPYISLALIYDHPDARIYRLSCLCESVH